MADEEVYELYIEDSFTPETIPMARLAEYMASFAGLLGYPDHVHFGRLKAGSLSIAARVDSVAQRRVDKRIEEVRYGGGPESARKAFKEIDRWLAEDNAVGRILRSKAKVVEFPGRTRSVASTIGSIRQLGTLDGEVILIGGRDETINVHLKADERVYLCVTSKAIARSMTPHLFNSPIRVQGLGEWMRSESGQWTLKSFQIKSFEALDEAPLSKVFEGLRARLAPPEGGRVNPTELVRQLRED
jgi:hypothetical protein